MHPVFLLIIGLLTGFYSLFKFIYGYIKTPAGSVFLGTVHHSTDYFIYLSEFAQGRDSWFWSRVLQSQDVPQPTLVRFTNVFFGRIFYLLGLDPVASYAVTVVLLTVLLIVVLYFLAGETVSRRVRPLVLLLYLTGNVFWTFAKTKSGFVFGTTDYWYNDGNPFNRIITIPHHLLGQIAVAAIVLVTIRWLKHKYTLPKKLLLLSIPLLSGLALGGINAVHLALTAVLVELTLFIWLLLEKPFSLKRIIRKFISASIPPVIAVAGGAPVIYQLKQVLSVPPYSQMINWEAYHQLYLNPYQFITGYGPLFLIAPVGLIFMIPKRSFPKLMSIIVPLMCIALYFSPIPEKLMLGKVRFLPPLVYFYITVLAAEGIYRIISIKPRLTPLLTGIFTVAYLVLTLPVFYLQIKDITSQYVDPTNYYFFMPRDYLNIMIEGRNISSANDTFLIPWPFAAPFPALTGRRVYFSEPLLANDANVKSYMYYNFFFGKLSTEEKRVFLVDNHITFIICRTSSLPPDLAPYLDKIDEKGGMGLWRVQQT